MNIELVITDQIKYDSNVESVDFSELNAKGHNQFEGRMIIETRRNGLIPVSGLIDSEEFVKGFGFILTVD